MIPHSSLTNVFVTYALSTTSDADQPFETSESDYMEYVHCLTQRCADATYLMRDVLRAKVYAKAGIKCHYGDVSIERDYVVIAHRGTTPSAMATFASIRASMSPNAAVCTTTSATLMASKFT